MKRSVLRRTMLLAIGALLVGIGLSGSAADPAEPATQPVAADAGSPEVEALIGQLGHHDWRLRDHAQGQLIELGPSVEARLRQLLAKGADEQTCLGAQAVLAQIEIARKLGPTLLSLHVNQTPPRQVFAELARLGGVPIVPVHGESAWDQHEWPAITLDVTDRPFWEVVRRACAQCELRPLFAGGAEEPGRIVLTADLGKEMERPVTFSGSFMVIATSAVRRLRLSADLNPLRAGEIELQLTFFADPKWLIVEHPEATAINAITDATGAALTRPEPMQMQAYKPESPIWMMRTMVPKAPTGVTKLGTVRGNFPITLLEQSPPVEFSEVMTARNVIKKVGRQALYLQEVSRQGNDYQVRITVSRNGLSEQEWRQARETDGMQLRDVHGKPFVRRSVDVRENGDQVSYDLVFAAVGGPDAPGTPAKLICTIPLEPRETMIPFELKDIAVEQ